ncbi:MAG TPA: ADP-ribosyltransferase [Nitrospira sp.]|nr:ADP-ribosyltransferase [Nitrospira sp.]
MEILGTIIVRRAENVQATGNVMFGRYVRDGRGRFAPKAAGKTGVDDGGYTPGGYAGMHGKSKNGGGVSTPTDTKSTLKRTKSMDNADATLNRADAHMSKKYVDGDPRMESLLEYVGNGYKPMNEFARTGKGSGFMSKGAAKHVKNLDDAFESHGVTTDAPITVHRGVSGSYANSLGKLKQGDVITERGFMSTSASTDIPRRFTGGAGRSSGRGGSGGEGKVLEINAPPGKKVLAGAYSEKELIFPRNTQLRYTGTSPSGAIQFDVI